MSDLVEEWRPVVGYEGYYSVSSLGRVRREFACHGARVGRILTARAANETGYFVVALMVKRRQRTIAVHRLVLEAFVSPCPPGMEACHFPDPDKGNNALSNLRWDTRSANYADRVRHGRGLKGRKRPNFRWLTQEQLDQVAVLRAAGMKPKAISQATGISRAQVHRLLNGTAKMTADSRKRITHTEV